MFKELSRLSQKHVLPRRAFIWIIITLLSALFIPTARTELNSRQEDHQSMIVDAGSRTIWVPSNYTKIQWAINNANEGDIIRVRAGLYNENVVVNKTVSIIGENKDNTILDEKGTLFHVTADNVIISGFTLRNGYAGVWLWYSNNVTIRGNNIDNNAYGIKADCSSNSTISENNISNIQWFSIVLEKSGNNTLQNNHIVGTRYSLRIDGELLPDFVNNIDTTNTVNSKPVYYMINQHNLTIDSSTFANIGYLALINSTNITVKNLNLMYNGQGILFAHTRNSMISNLTTTNNWNGIEVKAGSNVTVTGNNANNNFDFGIKFEHSSNSVVSRNNVNNNGWAGIGIFTSQNSIVNANIVKNNINYGIDLVYSYYNIVTRNNVTNAVVSYSQRIASIVLYYSNFNLIYHNNFNNYYLFEDVNITNTWDNGLEGNYWQFYRSGESWIRHSSIDANQDGIGDTPYIINATRYTNQDRYPLMGKISIFNMSQEYVTIISNLTISNFRFDQINKILSFNTTNENETGFCRMRIPKALVGDAYEVLVNNRMPLTLKILPYSNSTFEYVYLTFAQSSPQRNILESLAVPILLVSSLLIAFTLLVVTAKKKARITREKTKTVEKPASKI